MPVEPYDLWVHPLPPSIAAYFTRAQLAAIRVVNEEVMEHGACELSMDALAERAMMVTAPRVVTACKRLGLIRVEKLPGSRGVSRITITNTDWKRWLEMSDDERGLEAEAARR
jgi:hypothetical protein